LKKYNVESQPGFLGVWSNIHSGITLHLTERQLNLLHNYCVWERKIAILIEPV